MTALLLTMVVQAQVVHVTGNVYRMMKTITGDMQQVPVSIPVYIFDNDSEARRQAK